MTIPRDLELACLALRDLRNPYQDFAFRPHADGSVTIEPRGLTAAKHAALVDVGKPLISRLDLDGASVLDVGAATGYWSFLAAMAGASKVIACEPDVQRRALGMRIQREALPIIPALAAVSWPESEAALDLHRQQRFSMILSLSAIHHQWRMHRDYRAVATWYADSAAPKAKIVIETPLTQDHIAQKIGYRDAPMFFELSRRVGAVDRAVLQTISPTRRAWRFRAGVRTDTARLVDPDKPPAVDQDGVPVEERPPSPQQPDANWQE